MTGPDNLPATITITGIRQDESVNDGADGNTCPDGSGIGAGTALVRAERNGGGDGRVYQIAFRARDTRGDVCQGTVTVCVPGQGGADGCVDEGPRFDSTGPCDDDCDDACRVTSMFDTLAVVGCADDELPTDVTKRIASARRALQRLAHAKGPFAADRLMARAARLTRQAHARTLRAGARGAISTACARGAGGALDAAGALTARLLHNP